MSLLEQYKSPSGLASQISPVLRGLLHHTFNGRISFSSSCEAQSHDQKHVWHMDLPESSLDNLYDSLKLKASEDKVPDAVHIAGLGCFSLLKETDLNGRLSGKVVVVTGAAQGFGEGIARELAKQGAYLVIADLNDTLAEEVADSINRQTGFDQAVAIKVDVADEASVERMVEQTVGLFGGLDLLVSNAGVLRAGGLEEMTLQAFEFVTKINYTAFFIVTKVGSRPMKLQARYCDDYSADIVQINSKSGLEGSNKNFAYAGGKFGGIGLVQSFAKELVEDRIKVNAICPGNYYEGPLWSDPEKGLFIQYLKTGKVPGAKTVDDVYQSYVDKVPMRRGCSPEDVSRAIMYCVEQQYETGQAIPVTGGQSMLK